MSSKDHISCVRSPKIYTQYTFLPLLVFPSAKIPLLESGVKTCQVWARRKGGVSALWTQVWGKRREEDDKEDDEEEGLRGEEGDTQTKWDEGSVMKDGVMKEILVRK